MMPELDPAPTWAAWEVRLASGVPTLHRAGAPRFALGACRPYLGSEVRCFERLAGAGLRNFQMDTTCAEDIYHPALRFWHEDGTFGSEAQEENFRRLAAIAPDAVWMLRCYAGAPAWWTKRHPGECQIGANGERTFSLQAAGEISLPSLGSDLWRRDICVAMERFCHWLEDTGWSRRVFSILPCYGITWEWGILGSDYLPDYSAPARRWFSLWLERKYRSEAALRDAWRRDVTFATAEIPPLERRLAGGETDLRDASQFQDVIDHQQSISAMNAEVLLALCGAIKKATQRRVLVTAFYGYTLTAREQSPFTGRYGAGGFVGGHHALAQVLAHRDIDALASPFNYACRRPGAGLLYGHCPEGSVSAAGKLLFHENDNYSFNNIPNDDSRIPALDVGIVESWGENREMLRWAVGSALVRGHHQWLTELSGWLGPMAENFSSPLVLDEIRRLSALAEKWIGDDRSPVTGVAFVIEEQAVAATRLSSKLFLEQVYHAHSDWGRLGFPFDLVLLEEMVTRQKCPYLAVVTAYVGTTPGRQNLSAWCAKHGAHRVGESERGLDLAPRSGLRERLIEVGIHAYAPDGVNVWANRSHLLAQGPPGVVELDFADCRPVFEAFSGSDLQPDAKGKLLWDFAARPTALFRKAP